MRQEPTDAERVMWAILRRNQIDGLHFRREHAINSFFVDFYCAELRLAIEVDGDPHFTKDGRAYDDARTKLLNEHGVTVMRFENRVVIANPTLVANDIFAEARRLRAPLSPTPLPE